MSRSIAPGVHRFEKVLPSGWSLNMLAVELPDRGLLVHSPTWLGDGTFDELDALGEVRVLVAPNNYHHLSLARFRERYPRALAVASAAARPRLAKKGHHDLRDLEDATPLLPPGASWLVCAGTKSGEAFLSLAGDGGPTWIVCDAFFHLTRPVRGITGMALRALEVTPGLALSRTYKWLALSDARAYAAWLLGELERTPPVGLVVSHGDPVFAPDLAARLAQLVRARL